MQNDGKGRKIFSNDLSHSNTERSNAEHDAMASSSYDQEELDEMWAKFAIEVISTILVG